MTESIFIEQLKQLSESDWNAIFSGQGLLMVNDQFLEVGSSELPNVILSTQFFSANDQDAFKQHTMETADQLYSNYYRTHPLTVYGFNDQFYRLIQKFSPNVFCASAGQRAEKTLFVEGGELMALGRADPRYAYGVFCELPHSIKSSGIVTYFSHWIEQGDAYEAYLSMNVCRYNC